MRAITLAECHQRAIGRESGCGLEPTQADQRHDFDAFQLRVGTWPVHRPHSKGAEEGQTKGAAHPDSSRNTASERWAVLSHRINAGHRYCRCRGLQRSYKAITTLRDRLDKSRLLRRIAQSFPEPGNRAVQAMIKVDECISRPELFTQLFPRNHSTGSLHQQKQNTE